MQAPTKEELLEELTKDALFVADEVFESKIKNGLNECGEKSDLTKGQFRELLKRSYLIGVTHGIKYFFEQCRFENIERSPFIRTKQHEGVN